MQENDVVCSCQCAGFLFEMKFMKAVVALLLTFAFAATVHADIQQPPASDYGPTRKLGRGISNIAFGASEIIDSIEAINYEEGNSAAWSYGVVRGFGRFFARLGYGVYEVALFPVPNYKGTYYPPYRSDIPWINSGIQEFPPELGWNSRYSYVRDYQRDPN